MPPIIREQWADALEPGIREWAFLGIDRPEFKRTQLFNVMPSSKMSEYFENFGALSPDAWDEFRKTRVIPKVGRNPGYKTTLTADTFVLGVDVEREMVEDNLYPQITDMATALGDSFGLKQESDAASIFNNAFTDTAPYAGADSVGLCSTAHPNSPTDSNTQGNEGTYSLTKANVATVRRLMMAFKDDKGQLCNVIPNMLLVDPTLEDDALVIANSALDPTSANNAINPNSGRWQVVVWPYLTDTNAWFMIDSRRMKRDLLWIERVAYNVYREAKDETVTATWLARARYSRGWRDWRWVYGNNPS